jgi:alpha 1,2-mannosyltransferase
MSRSAIIILTQNTIERKIYLKTSLYFLFKNFNAKYKYPVIILHDGDYDTNAMNEINSSIRKNFRYLIEYKKIDDADFEIPKDIDENKMNRCINIAPVPYWRNRNYRLMCNFWINNFIKYCDNYDYIMRIDDDSIIEETINTDIFKLIEDKNLNYMSNIIHVDCGICNYGMKNFFEKILPDKKEKINELFMSHILDIKNEHFEKFKKLYLELNNEEYKETSVNMNMPVMYYNNFSVIRTSVWKSKEVKEIINKVNETGNIFYCRWGDGPLQTIIMTLYDKDKLSKLNFKYSKRLQRESFKDENGEYHSYMPSNYTETSCVSEINKKIT